LQALDDLAGGWRPFRSWVALLLRRWWEDGAPDLGVGASRVAGAGG
jgi:hypothetical protein